MSELKDCPFCGGKPQFMILDSFIHCECGAQFLADSHQSAVWGWNKRGSCLSWWDKEAFKNNPPIGFSS